VEVNARAAAPPGRLREHRQAALLYRTLATLREDAPIPQGRRPRARSNDQALAELRAETANRPG
jgi:hypothetical protein